MKIKSFLLIMVGITISTITSYAVAESTINSKNVYYEDNSELMANNVQDAIDGSCTKFDNKLSNFKKELLNEIYPLGSIYISTTLKTPTEVQNKFGGTWEVYGAGRTLVGVGTSDQEFKINETGGESSHKLTVDEMPSHTHIQEAHKHSVGFDGPSTAQYIGYGSGGSEPNISHYFTTGTLTAGARRQTLMANLATAINQNTGGSQSHNNLQPYITVYMYVRTN